MRLEIRQKVVCGPNIIEREIILEEDDDTLNQVQVETQQERYAPFIPRIPLDNLEIIQGPNMSISFPLQEMLISKVFEGERKRDNVQL